MGRFNKALKAEIASYDDSDWTGELGGEIITLLAKPLTPADFTKIGRKHPDFGHRPSLEGMVDMLIMKTHDDTGSLAFDKGDKPLMMRVGTTKIGDIFHTLFGSQLDDYGDEEHEDAVKN